MTTIKCSYCATEKDPQQGFTKSQREKAVKGNKAKCRECVKAYNYQRSYGVEYKKIEEKLEESGYFCEICSCAIDEKTMKQDHDHSIPEKGKNLRGLLCNNCNLMLGHGKDDPMTLFKGAMYIVKWKQCLSLYEEFEKLSLGEKEEKTTK